MKVATEVRAGREMFSESNKNSPFKVGDNSLDSRKTHDFLQKMELVKIINKIKFVTYFYLLEHSRIINSSLSGHAAKQQRNLYKMSFAGFYETVVNRNDNSCK